MKRRDFLLHSSLLTGGAALVHSIPTFARDIIPTNKFFKSDDLYEIFKSPATGVRPFVRWWWNGDKVDKAELSRELKLMKDAGIGGVEINPIKFPQRTDDLGKPSLQWLGNEWLDALEHTFAEAKALGLTCDLIVGSGWPFGAEYLEGEERAQILLIGTKKLEGKLDYEASIFDLLKEADPAVSSPHPRRKMEILSVKLVPDPFSSMEEVQDITSQLKTGFIKVAIPNGKFVLYTLVKIHSFLEVINGAPGADGSVLNHYDKVAVSKFLNHMSTGIQKRTGPLSKHVRALFTDSMELEGANWTKDMEAEFKKRRGYDLLTYLPFTQFKVGSMGNVFNYEYGAVLSADMKNMIQRVRYDFELTKTELLHENFVDTFSNWCHENGVKSRGQAYGRGYFPLEGSFAMDIPECETWIKAGIGKEMSETDTRIGRGYTMVNKYVSSAAHLKGRRLISCEELTNTDVVFNTTLELMKVTGDLSIISGVTHPVFHGFNYSPPQAPFPGWVRYGTYINEHNTWWPYFKKFADYKARMSALLQQADMFADIAILPPLADMWSIYGAQNEPFPSFAYPNHLSLVWEAMHQNGNACDYISEGVIRDAEMKDGQLQYGPRKYHTIFLIQVDSVEPATAKKLLEFLQNGGRIFCLDVYPQKSLGWADYEQKDKEVRSYVDQMKAFGEHFVLLSKPEKEFIHWYKEIQIKYNIAPYVQLNKPNRFVTQVRYENKDADILYFINASMDDAHVIEIKPNNELLKRGGAWIWNAENGERYKLDKSEKILLDLGPADSVVIVFDKTKGGKKFIPKPAAERFHAPGINSWSVDFRHIDGKNTKMEMTELKDLKDIQETVSFCGTVTYRGILFLGDQKASYLNLGKVLGVSEVILNGVNLGVQWYGRRIFDIEKFTHPGNNTVEIKVTTTMGNYMKTLKDNPVAQYWTNGLRKTQPIQSMGLLGPLTIA
jgi:hypothetical protein